MSHRKDPNRKAVKTELIKRYGKRCWLCGRKFSTRKKLELHHIIKWCDYHETNTLNTSLLCEECHKNLHYNEKKNPELYKKINTFLLNYKGRH